MNVDLKLAYEVAKGLLMEKENKILELTIINNQTLNEVEMLKKEIKLLENEIGELNQQLRNQGK